MLPKDLENYLSEVSRVLKTEGRCLITFFLLNPASKQSIETKTSQIDFRYEQDCYRTVDKNIPEKAIAYDEKFVRRLYEKHELNVVEPIHYGSWSGRVGHVSFQDLVVATKD